MGQGESESPRSLWKQQAGPSDVVRRQARGPHSELEAAEEALGAAGRHLWVRERIRLHHRALARCRDGEREVEERVEAERDVAARAADDARAQLAREERGRGRVLAAHAHVVVPCVGGVVARRITTILPPR